MRSSTSQGNARGSIYSGIIKAYTHYHLYHRLRSIPSGITYNVSTLTHHKDVRCRSVHFISRTIASDVIRETVPCIRTLCVPRTEEIVADAPAMVLSPRNANRKSRLQSNGTNLLLEFKYSNLLEISTLPLYFLLGIGRNKH